MAGLHATVARHDGDRCRLQGRGRPVPAGAEALGAARPVASGRWLKLVPMAEPKFPAPERGLFSTAGDMARFHQMLLEKGTLNGQHILSAAGVEEMTSSHTGSMKAGFAPGVGRGFGFEVVRETLGTFRYNSIGSFVKGPDDKIAPRCRRRTRHVRNLPRGQPWALKLTRSRAGVQD